MGFRAIRIEVEMRLVLRGEGMLGSFLGSRRLLRLYFLGVSFELRRYITSEMQKGDGEFKTR